MHPEVQAMLEQAAPTPHRGPNVQAIIAGGQRLKTQRRARQAVGSLVAVAAVALVMPWVFGQGDATRSDLRPIRPAAPREKTEPFRESRPLEGQAYVDRIRGEEKYLVGEKRIVASGTVEGEPWSMVEYVKAENGDDPSLCVEFFLGRDGHWGGGGNCATPKHTESLVTLSGQYWGDVPDLVAVVGSIQAPAVAARVELEDGRTRPLEILTSAKDEKIGWYVFFPPPFEEGRVVAFNTAGNHVGSAPICFPIVDGEFSKEPPPAGSNVGCSQ